MLGHVRLTLHRSITFWSGILVMAFICWLWRDSFQWASAYTASRATLTNARGGMSMHWIGVPSDWSGSYTPAKGGLSRERDRGAKDYARLQRPFFLRGLGRPLPPPPPAQAKSPSVYEMLVENYSHVPPRFWIIFAPHWLIVLAFAALWIVLLLWRAKRRKAHS